MMKTIHPHFYTLEQNCIRIFLVAVILIFPRLVLGQWILSEVEQMGFIATSRGIYASKINPAGLAIADGDDGILLNYSIDSEEENPQHNFLLSMGNVGFSYQKDENQLQSKDFLLESFALSLSYGNSVFSVGNTTKWIKSEYMGDVKELPNSDIGVIFRPISSFSLAGKVQNLSEAEIIDGFPVKRRYSAGFSTLLFEDHLVLNSEGIWQESATDVEDVTFKVGITLYPVEKFNFIAGWQRKEEQDKHFWVGASINLGGISLGISARTLDGEEIERISANFRAGLQSVQF